MQAFHALYHTDENVLLGAPTGSGKTISAELAMMRVFNHYPGQKIIYIAPLKVHSTCSQPTCWLETLMCASVCCMSALPGHAPSPAATTSICYWHGVLLHHCKGVATKVFDVADSLPINVAASVCSALSTIFVDDVVMHG